MKKIDHATSAYKKSGFIKTSEIPANKEQVFFKENTIKDKEKKTSSSGLTKAAKLLLLVDPDQAAKILKQFNSNEIEQITKEIANVRKIGKKESEQILKEFVSSRKDKHAVPPQFTGVVKGGPEKALGMLQSALGKEKGQEIFKKVLPFGGRRPFDFLNELQPEQILLIMKNEPPYVMSIVLSFLKPEVASIIVSKLPPESRKEIILRIARQGQIAPGIIERMEGVFRDRIRTQGQIVTEEINGRSILAEILRNMDIRTEEKILTEITKENKDIAREIKDGIYTINMILKMSSKDVQFLLRDFDNSELAIIIKGKPKKVKDCILENVSERRKEIILEESLHLGKMSKSDVDKATKELINYLVELEKNEEVFIPRGDEKWI